MQYIVGDWFSQQCKPFSQLYFFFSSISLYQGFLMVGYATVYTMFPVFSLVLDKDVSYILYFFSLLSSDITNFQWFFKEDIFLTHIKHNIFLFTLNQSVGCHRFSVNGLRFIKLLKIFFTKKYIFILSTNDTIYFYTYRLYLE